MKSLLIIIIIYILTSSFLFSQDIVIKAAYTDWEPYTYTENNDAKGFEIEIFSIIMDKMNIKVEYESLPWKRCLNNLKTGESDVVISMFKTDERELYTIYPEENISRSTCSFFVLESSNVKFNGDYNNIYNDRIGVILGFNYGDEFSNESNNLQKIDIIDSKSLLDMVSKKRVHIGLDNRLVIHSLSKKANIENSIRFLEPPVVNDPLYIGFSKKNKLENLCKSFSDELKAFKQTDRYLEITKRYNYK